MKIRMFKDSLRLRLTPAEVKQLIQTDEVRETTHFGPQSALSCVLTLANGLSEICASFESREIFVSIPRALGIHWAESSDVSLTSLQSVDSEASLKILVEKDFECLHSAEEVPGVTFYPNPRKHEDAQL